MAKKNIEEEEVKLNGMDAETAEPKGTQEDSLEVSVSPAVKKVDIHTTDVVDCYIGRVHYDIAKGKDAKVPADVAAILVNSQKAYRV